VYNKALVILVCDLVIYIETTVPSIDDVVRRVPPHSVKSEQVLSILSFPTSEKN
jgi:hypothetical protein